MCLFERSSTMKIGFERVIQEKRLVEFAGYITLAGNQPTVRLFGIVNIIFWARLASLF